MRFYGDRKIQLTLRNIYDVIKILFADWSIKIFILTYRKGKKKNNHYSDLSGVYHNSTDTLKNMYDVIKIPFADWSMKLFIIMYGMDHKTLSTYTSLYGFMDKFLHFTNLYYVIKTPFSD